ncbi:MAG: MBL fold metallo-hydrolase [Streptosporangiales bacterium]|nr:MBL fold metallo-hydrolase [Streptosporangiales bacterium]
MRLTVLGVCGARPEAGRASSGYLVEHDGFRLIMDLGYATFPRLLEYVPAGAVDAVLISHGHPDHCVDINPLLRARAQSDRPPPVLPLYSLAGALDAVLALDRPGMLDAAYALRTFRAGDGFKIGPFTVRTQALPHYVANAGFRLEADGSTLAYTGDTGGGPGLTTLARDADLLLADASFAGPAPTREEARCLGSAPRVGRQATAAGVGRLLLTHLLPDTDPAEAERAAAGGYDGPLGVATEGLVVEI